MNRPAALRLPILLLCVFFAPSLCLAASGPLSAVTAAQKAVDAADVNAFNAAVDVDALLQNGLEQGLAEVCRRAAAGTLPSMEPMLAMAVAGIASDCRPDNPQLVVLRGLAQSEARSFVTAGVGGGWFAGKPNGRTSENSMHSRLLRGMSTARKKLVPGAVLSQTGDTAEVSAELRDAEAGVFPLRLKVERSNTAWRVTEVLNVHELVQKALDRR